MTRSIPFILALCLSVNITFAQHTILKYNFGFEAVNDKGFPEGWMKWGTPDFQVKLDSSQVYSGKFSTLVSPGPESGSNSFGSIAYPLNSNYEGTNVTVEAFMKIEAVSEGFAGLVLRIDGDGKTFQFDNMQGQKIQGTHDWKKYSITLPLAEGADKIYVAGILVGKGKAWFDSFEVFIDNTKIQEAKIVERPVSKASLDKSFDNGSKIEIQNLSVLQHQSLVKLGRVWGFLKYYHPVVRSGEINWDYELFRILPAVLQAKSANEVNKYLLQWIEKIGGLKKREQISKSPEKNLKFEANSEWIDDQKYLGKQLSALLLTVQLQERDQKSYYVALTPMIGNPQFKNENAYPKISYDDDGFRLLSLYRYWNMIEYYFPYKPLTDEKWENVLNDFVPKVINATDELSYKLTLLELIGKVRDTHANIWQRDEVLGKFWGLNAVPIQLKYVEDKVVITRILANDVVPSSVLKIGDIITHVDGVPVKDLISQKIKYCPASNLPTQYRDVMMKLLRTNNDSLKISVDSESSTKDVTLKTSRLQNLNFRENIPSHKLLDSNIGYIYPASLQPDEINTIMKKFVSTKGLIIDLRCYPSDFIVFKLGQHLNQQPVNFVKFTAGSLEKPGRFLFTEPLKVGSNNSDFYKGKVVILINETTQSQAEYTTMALRATPNATVIGSTTAGADGNVSEIILPGNVRTMISGIGVYYPDGRETQRVGIIPDIEVKPTIKGIKNGRDEQLEKAIDLINN